jgi:hypothetical protein
MGALCIAIVLRRARVEDAERWSEVLRKAADDLSEVSKAMREVKG